MSRVAKRPVPLPQGVTATIGADSVTLKGAKGSLSVKLAANVSVAQEEQNLCVKVAANDTETWALAGSTRAHLANMAKGVSTGFEQKLELVGVGYRASVQGKVLNLTLGYYPRDRHSSKSSNIQIADHVFSTAQFDRSGRVCLKGFHSVS